MTRADDQQNHRGLPMGDRLFARLVELRRELHRHPELSWQEEATARRVERELDRLGIAHRRLAGTGVVAELPAEGEARRAPAVALRADMDALPIHEETGLPFASENPGVMHACGHDGHTTMLLGAAELLVRGDGRQDGDDSQPPPLAAPVRLLFQPAEETGEGARRMIAEGALDGVGRIFGGHLDRLYPAGTLAIADGAVNASDDSFTIVVDGQGAHGARPHEGRDALLAACRLVEALQGLISREVDPGQPAALTVGSLRAGTAPNVLAARAELTGTVRCLDPEVRAQLIAAVERTAAGTAAAGQVTARVSWAEAGLPPLVNRPEEVALARAAAAPLLADGALRTSLATVNLGSEDFSCYLEQLPGCYIRIGARPAGGPGHPAHSSRFDIDERALAYGAAWLAAVGRAAGRDAGARDASGRALNAPACDT